MKNKYNICSNISNKEKTNAIAEIVLETIKNSVALSLGPFGGKAILEGTALDHKMTKDGYSILKRIKFNDPIANTFLEMYRDASLELVSTVGDGSTTTIIAAYYLFIEFKKLLENTEYRPIQIIEESKKVVAELSKMIQNAAIRIDADSEKLKSIASVSLNNDDELGGMIADIYKEIGREGFISVKLSNTRETRYERTNGFAIDAGYLDKALINAPNGESVTHNALVLLFNAFVTDEKYTGFIFDTLNLINSKQLGNYDSLVVLAPDFGTEFKKNLMTLDHRYAQSGAKKNYNFINYRVATDSEAETLDDLAASLNATVIKVSAGQDIVVDETTREAMKKNPEVRIAEHSKAALSFGGSAKTVVSSKHKTVFTDTTVNKDAVDKIINDIKAEQAKMNEEKIIDLVKEFELKKRLSVLNNNLITIYVGGDSEAERISRKDLIDDAIAACKSALEYGYVPGCDVSVLVASETLLTLSILEGEELYVKIVRAIRDAFTKVYTEVLKNSHLPESSYNEIIEQSIIKNACFDLTTNKYDDTYVIINSAETETQILTNVVSIIIMILTCNQYICTNANEIVITTEDK